MYYVVGRNRADRLGDRLMALKVLYISGSIGLGHVNRDLAIATAIRSLRRDVEISWLAAEPASSVLRNAGEHLHPQIDAYVSDTVVANRVASNGTLSLLTYAMSAYREWVSHARLVRRILAHEQFDAIVGDETYELLIARIFHLLDFHAPFLMIYDFLGLDTMTPRLTEQMGVYLWNAIWSLDSTVLKRTGPNQAVFIGEPEDVPDTRFGPFLPRRRRHAQRHYRFVGYILPFDPITLSDRAHVRALLGYGEHPLVVCAVGGTAVGRGLLELCARTYPLLTKTIPDLQMTLVCGPSIAPESLEAPRGVDIRGFVPELYKHFAAADLAVVQGGGTTTLELTALRRPFIYFPVEGQSEQILTVAARLARQGAGIHMSESTTTPAALADVIARTLGTPVDYPPIAIDGAHRIAETVLSLISASRRHLETLRAA